VTAFLQRLEAEIRNRRLLKRGEKILVAVSGGVDSMVLLHSLEKLSSDHKWKIVVAHFNHQLRGRASNADENLVRRTAAKLKLPIVVGSENVRRFAEIGKFSIEMAARRLRHRFLARMAKANNIRAVALAHHADDQVEHFFLRLLRGAGTEGLAGMKSRSPSPLDKNVALIRPLLGFSKSELAKFAHENKIHFRDDATNFSLEAPRNRIRNELLPLLKKKYQLGLNETVLRLMEIIGAESEFIGDSARRWLAKGKSGAEKYADLPVAIQRRVLQLKLAELGFAANFKLVEQLRLAPGRRVNLWPGLFVSRTRAGGLVLERERESAFSVAKLAVDLTKRKREAVFGGMKFTWRILPRKQICFAVRKPAGGPPALREFFDAHKIGGKVVLRHWRPGDRFQLIGLKSPAKLQDLFTNAKIPRDRRRSLIVAEAADGAIFWVEGLRIGERFKLTPQTTGTLVWRWSNLTD
jgi:tRNA(Ile)-lysidine synthase